MSEEEDVGIPCEIRIRRNSDGAVRTYRDNGLDYFNDYMWREGNFSCDCNRYLFFCRAVDEDEDEEYPCGDSRYDVAIYDMNGALLFEDWHRHGVAP